MMKGWFRGFSGLLYIYYRGESQLVLSDVNAGFNLGKNMLANTALRVVLRPKTWTQCAASYVQSGLEEGTSILANLEKTNMVDIYTDPEEVRKIEATGLDPRVYEEQMKQQSQMPVQNQAPAYPGYYPQAAQPMGAYPPYPQQPMQQTPYQSPYFDMNMMPKPMPYTPKPVQQAPVIKPEAKPAELAPELRDVLKAIKEQATANAKQAETVTNMMAAMTKSLETLAASFNKPVVGETPVTDKNNETK